jgi:hypothetical protein
VRAANLNHGPASTLWHCIGAQKDIEKFRAKAQKTYDFDLFKNEGLWFADIDWCLGHKLKVITFNQRPGDLVMLKGGTLHWVKSLGLTSQTAWNMATCDVDMLKTMMHRYELNKKIGFKSIIPM